MWKNEPGRLVVPLVPATPTRTSSTTNRRMAPSWQTPGSMRNASQLSYSLGVRINDRFFGTGQACGGSAGENPQATEAPPRHLLPDLEKHLPKHPRRIRPFTDPPRAQRPTLRWAFFMACNPLAAELSWCWLESGNACPCPIRPGPKSESFRAFFMGACQRHLKPPFRRSIGDLPPLYLAYTSVGLASAPARTTGTEARRDRIAPGSGT